MYSIHVVLIEFYCFVKLNFIYFFNFLPNFNMYSVHVQVHSLYNFIYYYRAGVKRGWYQETIYTSHYFISHTHSIRPIGYHGNRRGGGSCQETRHRQISHCQRITNDRKKFCENPQCHRQCKPHPLTTPIINNRSL